MGEHFLKADNIGAFLPERFENQGLTEFKIVFAVPFAVQADIEGYYFNVFQTDCPPSQVQRKPTEENEILMVKDSEDPEGL